MRCVGFRGHGQHDHRLAQGEFRLGEAQLEGGVAEGFYDLGALGPGETDIFRRRAEDPSDGGHEIPGGEKTGEPVEGGVGVAPPHGFHQGGGQVVGLVAAPVVTLGRSLPCSLDVGSVQGRSVSAGFGICHGNSRFQNREGLAGVAGGEGCDFISCVRGEHDAFPDGRPADGFDEFFLGYGLEFEDEGAAEERPVDIEVRIFSGGADETDPAGFHVGEEELLLFFVQVLDLVQIEQDTIVGGVRFVRGVLEFF